MLDAPSRYELLYRQTCTCSSSETDILQTPSAIELLMMVEEGSLVEIYHKCCVLETVARWFPTVLVGD